MENSEGSPGAGNEFDKIEGDIKEALAEVEDSILEASSRLERAEMDLRNLQRSNEIVRELGQEAIDEASDVKIIGEIKDVIAKLEDTKQLMREQLRKYYEVDEHKYQDEQ